ncbi:putative sugar epimerase YhfK [Corynebacterium capitovis DSM 44611]|uniref:NAD(P)H-binding protein n=1 Tax=Corynebacterium capitovis TaxID=131081 RepID=UPI000367A87F|nr:NAD(P)H-binding protein [Corynebacterium capitovis]WKD57643.1 putative sugar epimerase YhfK [Corynebacterium capitovis DSM 44611]
MNRDSRILVLGAGGRVSALAVPLLVEQGHRVTGLVRDPRHEQPLIDAGASPLLRDLTATTVSEWVELLPSFETVVWSAGAGGGDAARTFAVDRDAAMTVVDALEQLGDQAPRLVMVSYAGAMHATAEDDGSSWYAYVESKKAVDKRLSASQLTHIILGPGALTDKPSTGIEFYRNSSRRDTPRELVAQVIAEVVGRASWDGLPNPLEFVGGAGSVSDL